MKKTNSTGESIFSKLLRSLFGKNDPEAEKRRLLKNISKDLSKSRYKFYKYSQNEALPALGKTFYDIYKLISPVQLMFQNSSNNPNYFKNHVVDYSLNDTQKDIVEELQPDSIKELSKTLSFKELSDKIQQDTATFTGEFDADKILHIDALYSQLVAFKSFCMYDFYFLLKKFSSGLKERDFNIQPKFETIQAEYISDDIKDFITVAWALPFEADWSELFQLFKSMKGVEPISLSNWKKIMSKIKQLKDSKVLDMMLQLINKDPTLIVNVDEIHERIIDAYLDKLKTQSNAVLKGLQAEQRNNKIDSLVKQIFDTGIASRLKNYTDRVSTNLEKKALGSYTFHAPLGYLKAFLLDYVKKDIREYCDLVLIRGKWTTADLSSPMSNAYHSLLDISDKITAFDARLGDDGEIGSKIKSLMPRISHDREAANIIRTKVRDANDIAKELLKRAKGDLVTIAKNTKALLEDHEKTNSDMIINWKEIDHYAEHPVKELGVEVYKKIYLFVQLLQNFV
ncbi:MAG: DUF5312 family protein [Treponema sp.]|nr:DUF5312 family protein [Treponema sp.]